MECQVFQSDVLLLERIEHLRSIVKASCRSRYTALDARIDGLISLLVLLFGSTIEVGRNRQFAHRIEQLCKTDRLPTLGLFPEEMNQLAGAQATCSFAEQCNRLAVGHGHAQRERSLLPFLAVADQACPGAFCFAGKVLLIILRRLRFQAEHLDDASRRLPEVQAGLYHLRIVEYNHRTSRNLVRQVAEVMLFNRTLPHQQFALVALRERIFCYSFLGKIIVVILDLEITWIHHYI